MASFFAATLIALLCGGAWLALTAIRRFESVTAHLDGISEDE